MAKAVVLCFQDADRGAAETDFIVYATVVFMGVGVPGGLLSSQGPNGDGRVPISFDLLTLNQYANRVEDALLAEATRLGVTGLTRADCLFPNYVRGA